MMFSTKAEYGVRVMVELARRNGDSPVSLADIAVMPALVRMHDLGMPDWQDLPRVVTWFDNIRAQPAFASAYYHGSLLSERFPHLRENVAKTA